MPHPKPFSDADKAYILANHHNTPVNTMAKYIQRGNQTIYDYLDANGLKVFSPRASKRVPKGRVKTGFFEYDKRWII